MYEDLLGKKKITKSLKPKAKKTKGINLIHDEPFKLRIHKVGKETAVYIMKKGKWRLIDSIADFGDYDIEWSEYRPSQYHRSTNNPSPKTPQTSYQSPSTTIIT